ncbi:arylamine N-acetyltransferase family protein [Vibrio sonorensis]|uniref:arylamine N-acetyltransferase family protein n=1 Tax=Vibrio sonorensis TaxID=1004316 RepID=UPI001FE188B7|nr:arylamine N-acetyltransferase [Vibrio sonorensis]
MISEKDLSQYYTRIGLKQKPTISTDFLFASHRAQHRSIPFENFDVIQKGSVELCPTSVFNKLVNLRRGGYCFEVNGLLLNVLNALGFTARPQLARVHLSTPPSGRSHQVTQVSMGKQQWIVDAGFGSQTPRAPLPLEYNKALSTDIQTYRFVEVDNFGTMLQIKQEESWIDLYSLDFSHVCEGDIQYGNHFTSTHPDSAFTQSHVAALPIEDGIITLLNGTFKKSTKGIISQWRPNNDTDYVKEIESVFGIELTQPLSLPEDKSAN